MEQPGLESPTNRGPGKAYQAKAHLGSKALDGRGSDPRSPLKGEPWTQSFAALVPRDPHPLLCASSGLGAPLGQP